MFLCAVESLCGADMRSVFGAVREDWGSRGLVKKSVGAKGPGATGQGSPLIWNDCFQFNVSFSADALGCGHDAPCVAEVFQQPQQGRICRWV